MIIEPDKRLRKHRNPSFEGMLAPHCTLMPRYCYCSTDDGIRQCEIGRMGNHLTFGVVQPKFDGIYYRGPKHRGVFKGRELDYDEILELAAEEERRKKVSDYHV